MRLFFALLLLFHGAIHLLGFLKAFNLARISELQADVSRIAGVFWLSAFILFAGSAVAYLLKNANWHLLALPGLVISTILVLGAWSDARFGLLPNLIVLAVMLVFISAQRMERMIAGELGSMLAAVDTAPGNPISLEDLERLPAPVARWLSNCGIIGRPPIKSGLVSQRARLKMKPGQKNWYRAEAKHFFSTEPPAFVWSVDLELIPLLRIRGRDKFSSGRGEMLVKLLSAIKVVSERGVKLDEGTMQRYLGEIVWYPSAALSPHIRWQELDDLSAMAELDYKGTRGSGIFYFNEQGDFSSFSALRFLGNDPAAEKHEWIVTAEEYAEFSGIRVPSRMSAAWKLEAGDWTWLQLEISAIEFDIHE